MVVRSLEMDAISARVFQPPAVTLVTHRRLLHVDVIRRDIRSAVVPLDHRRRDGVLLPLAWAGIILERWRTGAIQSNLRDVERSNSACAAAVGAMVSPSCESHLQASSERNASSTVCIGMTVENSKITHMMHDRFWYRA